MPRKTRGFPPTRPLARRIACTISMGHYQRDLVLAGESGRRSGAVIEFGSCQDQTYLLVDLVLHIERLTIREQCRRSSRVYKHDIVVATPTTFANKGDQPRKALA